MATPKYDVEDRLADAATRVIQPVESLSHTRAGNLVAGRFLDVQGG